MICPTCKCVHAPEDAACPICSHPPVFVAEIPDATEKLYAFLRGMEFQNLDKLFGKDRTVEDFKKLGEVAIAQTKRLARIGEVAIKKAEMALAAFNRFRCGILRLMDVSSDDINEILAYVKKETKDES
jgi:hypothetical protein